MQEDVPPEETVATKAAFRSMEHDPIMHGCGGDLDEPVQINGHDGPPIDSGERMEDILPPINGDIFSFSDERERFDMLQEN
jgi:hypothetical protein